MADESDVRTDSDKYISDKPYAASFKDTGKESTSGGGSGGAGLATALLMRKYNPNKHKGKGKSAAKRHSKASGKRG